MRVHLIDGTYELFRHYYALPSSTNDEGREVAATRGVCFSVLAMLEDGATYLAVATDHVVESFRNELWPGYKDGSGIEPDLLSQFELLELALEAMGVKVWRMIEHEADDGLASGAAMAAADDRVEQVLICTPDKDLAQCVEGRRVVQLNRRERALIAGWGKKSASIVLARYGRLESIPTDPAEWDVEVRGKQRLAQVLAEQRELALLFRKVATVVRDAPVSASVDELRWSGPGPSLAEVAVTIGARNLVERVRARMPA